MMSIQIPTNFTMKMSSDSNILSKQISENGSGSLI